MNKYIAILLCLLSAGLGFLGGVFTTARTFVHPRQEFVKIQAGTFTTLLALSELRKSNLEYVIQEKERELDSYIVGLGVMARDGGQLGTEARQSLRRAGSYRSKVSYVPDSEIQQMVSDALKLAAQ
jgi:hypothetical protein